MGSSALISYIMVSDQVFVFFNEYYFNGQPSIDSSLLHYQLKRSIAICAYLHNPIDRTVLNRLQTENDIKFGEFIYFTLHFISFFKINNWFFVNIYLKKKICVYPKWN